MAKISGQIVNMQNCRYWRVKNANVVTLDLRMFQFRKLIITGLIKVQFCTDNQLKTLKHLGVRIHPGVADKT